jgi:hypothetical protein
VCREPPKYIQNIEFIWKIKQILRYFPQYFVPKDPKLPASTYNPGLFQYKPL